MYNLKLNIDPITFNKDQILERTIWLAYLKI